MHLKRIINHSFSCHQRTCGTLYSGQPSVFPNWVSVHPHVTDIQLVSHSTFTIGSELRYSATRLAALTLSLLFPGNLCNKTLQRCSVCCTPLQSQHLSLVSVTNNIPTMNDTQTLAHITSQKVWPLLCLTPPYLPDENGHWSPRPTTGTFTGCLQAKPQAQASQAEWTSGYLWLGRGHRYTAPAIWGGSPSNCLNSFLW